MELPRLLEGGGTLTYIWPMGGGAGGGTVTHFEPMRQEEGGSTWHCACYRMRVWDRRGAF